METKIVKVTDKGQISIPVSMRKAIHVGKGDVILMIENDKTIVMEKLKISGFQDLLKHSEKVAKKLWSNNEDDIWDSV